DSPTTLTISSASMVKETPLTARTGPFWVRNETVRSRTSRSGDASAFADAGVEDCISHIHNEIRGHHEEGRVDDRGQDDRKIEVLQGIIGELADALEPEHD